MHLPHSLLILTAALCALAFVAALVSKKKLEKYRAAGPLATPAELAFLKTLDSAVGPKERVFMKPRLIDVIEPDAARSNTGFHAAKARVIQKHLDYVICDRETLHVLYAIELNDKSHEAKHRRERDALVLAAMKSAGIPLIFVKAARSYEIDALRRSIAEATTVPTTG
jgi:hypothetical protein